ncbi:helix-turn-helix domain-containing protein [Clostridium sp.]|uniref:helix-turn-helix domain-containing protein n=1 Tax=Clostridium sp. TaxID=1506 RepID=UPI003F8123F1
MCRVYKIATFATIFSPICLNLNSIVLKKLKLGTFGEKLRYLRLERNLNQREFAKLLNYSFTSICNWEQGNRFPKIETIKDIAKILNVDYRFLCNSHQ